MAGTSTTASDAPAQLATRGQRRTQANVTAVHSQYAVKGTRYTFQSASSCTPPRYVATATTMDTPRKRICASLSVLYCRSASKARPTGSLRKVESGGGDCP